MTIRSANPALRLLSNLLRHKRWIVVASFVGAGVAAFAGMLSPLLFHSEAVIKIDPANKNVIPSAIHYIDPFLEASSALKDAEAIIHSDEVLLPVAEVLIQERAKFDLAFPARLRSTDIQGRFIQFAERLRARYQFAARIAPPRELSEIDQPAAVANLIRQQFSIRTDPKSKMLYLNVEAADRDLAQRMAQQIAEQFVNVSNRRDQKELELQKDYLVDTISLQDEKIGIIEGELQAIKRENPQVFASGSKAMSGPTSRYLRGQEELEEVSTKLATDSRLLEIYQKALANPQTTIVAERRALMTRVQEELRDAEYRRLEYIQVRGYSRNHPQIQEIDGKIAGLKDLLGSVRLDSKEDFSQAAQSGSIEERISSLGASVQALSIQSKYLESVLAARRSDMESSLSVESRVGSLSRDLNAHLEIMTELRRNLETVRMQIVGAKATASLLLDANYPVLPVTLSIPKRTMFGGVVGIFFLATLLFLRDQIRPRLWLRQDFRAQNIRFFGEFKFSNKSAAEFSACLMTLGNESRGSGKGTTILMAGLSVGARCEPWAREAMRELRLAGYLPGMIIVREAQGGIRRKTDVVDGVEITWLHPDEVPVAFSYLHQQMAAKHDFVVVLTENQRFGPATSFLTRSADYLLYLTRIGRSELWEINQIRESVGIDEGDSREHAIIFSA